MKPEKMDFQKISFGNYEDSTPESVAEYDPDYIVWAYENVANFCSEALYNDCVAEGQDDDESDFDTELSF